MIRRPIPTSLNLNGEQENAYKKWRWCLWIISHPFSLSSFLLFIFLQSLSLSLKNHIFNFPSLLRLGSWNSKIGSSAPSRTRTLDCRLFSLSLGFSVSIFIQFVQSNVDVSVLGVYVLSQQWHGLDRHWKRRGKKQGSNTVIQQSLAKIKKR